MFIPSAALYDETTHEVDLGYRLTDYFLELPAQIYELRQGTRGQRASAFLQLIDRVLAEDGRWAEFTRVHEAEAIHLLVFTLSTEMEPDLLYRDLQAPMLRLAELARRYAGVRRYHSLVRRTFSMVASKRDDYVDAYRSIVAAHRAIASGPADPELLTAEALQQLWLQECGQLIRLVETNMIEMDLQRQQGALRDGVPPTTARRRDELSLMAIVAAYGVFAGRMACEQLAQLRGARELPATPNPQTRNLAAAGWQLTAPIMYMRAILVKATVDLALGRDRHRWETAVQDLFAECAVSQAPMIKERVLDLNRVALHYSFLSGGDHPLSRIQLLNVSHARVQQAPHLFTSKLATLDRVACSQALAKENNDANILDNLGYTSFFNVFLQRGGDDLAGNGYASWLYKHRQLVSGRLQKNIDDAARDELIVRRSRRDTREALLPVAWHAVHADHYRAAGWR